MNKKATHKSLLKRLSEKVQFEYKITTTYLIIGVLWIVFSDRLLESLISDHDIVIELQTYKGSFYILVTALLLFFLIRRHLKKISAIELQKTERENRYKSLFYANNSVMLIIDPETQQITDANNAALDYYGYSHKEITSLTIDAINILSANEIHHEIEKAMQSKQRYFNFKHRLKSGLVRDVEVYSGKITLNNKSYLYSIVHDITDKKQQEQELHEMNLEYATLNEEYASINEELQQTNENLRNINEQLAQSEAQFRMLVENAPIAIFIQTDSYFTYANKAAVALYGAETADQLLNTSVLERIHPDYRELVKSRISTLNNELKTVPVTEYIHLKLDNTPIDVEVMAVPIKFNNQRGGLVFVHDISEHKKNLQQIKEQQLLFETMFNAISDGVIITTPSRTIIHANKGIEKTFGYQPENLIGKSAEVLYADREKFDQAGKAVFNERSLSSDKIYQTYYKDCNNNLFPGETFGAKLYNSQGQWIGNVSIVRNISERINFIDRLKQTRARALENERKYRYLFENNPLPMWIYGLKDLRFLMVNQAAIEKYGYSAEEFAQLTLQDIRPAADRQRLTEHIDKSIKPLSHSGIWTHLKKNGEQILVEITSHEAFYDNQEARLVISNDVTDKVKAELELIKAKEKAEESDQLKTAFLENISHEIRTPINIITGFTEIITKQKLDEIKRNELIETLSKTANRLLRIVDNTITLSQIETGQLRIIKLDFYPNTLLKNLYTEYENKKITLKKGHIEMQLTIDELNECMINSDYARINQILDILLENAFKFTSKGKVEFGYYLSNDRLNFFVKDTGLGIPKNKQEVIFKSFAQADQSIRQFYGGLGAGLSIAVGLVHLLGGSMQVESQINEGTRFIISFPYTQKLRTK